MVCGWNHAKYISWYNDIEDHTLVRTKKPSFVRKHRKNHKSKSILLKILLLILFCFNFSHVAIFFSSHQTPKMRKRRFTYRLRVWFAVNTDSSKLKWQKKWRWEASRKTANIQMNQNIFALMFWSNYISICVVVFSVAVFPSTSKDARNRMSCIYRLI